MGYPDSGWVGGGVRTKVPGIPDQTSLYPERVIRTPQGMGRCPPSLIDREYGTHVKERYSVPSQLPEGSKREWPWWLGTSLRPQSRPSGAGSLSLAAELSTTHRTDSGRYGTYPDMDVWLPAPMGDEYKTVEEHLEDAKNREAEGVLLREAIEMQAEERRRASSARLPKRAGSAHSTRTWHAYGSPALSSRQSSRAWSARTGGGSPQSKALSPASRSSSSRGPRTPSPRKGPSALRSPPAPSTSGGRSASASPERMGRNFSGRSGLSGRPASSAGGSALSSSSSPRYPRPRSPTLLQRMTSEASPTTSAAPSLKGALTDNLHARVVTPSATPDLQHTYKFPDHRLKSATKPAKSDRYWEPPSSYSSPEKRLGHRRARATPGMPTAWSYSLTKSMDALARVYSPPSKPLRATSARGRLGVWQN